MGVPERAGMGMSTAPLKGKVMLRIIDMREAVSPNTFAVWNTAISRFVEVDGCQTFDGKADLVKLYELDDTERELPKLGRIVSLLPEWATKCPNDTDGDGDCHLCHRDSRCLNE